MNSCYGKAAYSSEGEAKAKARKIQADNKHRGRRGKTRRREVGLNAYRCKACDSWHLGRADA